MVKESNECVGCQIGCIGASCGYRHVKRLYCDSCNDEVDVLYDVEGTQLCEDCTIQDYLDSLDKIEY